jgi:hypothetical protein
VRRVVAAIACGMLLVGGATHAEETIAPSADEVLDRLIALNPAELAAHLAKMKAELAALEKSVVEAKAQADAKTAEAEKIAVRLAPLMPKPAAPAPTAMAAAPRTLWNRPKPLRRWRLRSIRFRRT